MIDEPAFAKGLLEERVANEPSSVPAPVRWYAKPAVKVNVDNIAATVITSGIAGLVANMADASTIEAIAIGATIINSTHWLAYGACASVGNVALRRAGVEQRSLARELAEGYSSGAILAFAYNAAILPIQYALIAREMDAGTTIFASNLALTLLLTPARGFIYAGIDRCVDLVKDTARKLASRSPEAIE